MFMFLIVSNKMNLMYTKIYIGLYRFVLTLGNWSDLQCFSVSISISNWGRATLNKLDTAV